jgi:tRNA A-37 threonylcarbamoyl transferase component Bud32
MIGRIFLGRYEVKRLLGEGGMGKVYLARQTDLNRDVVVKVMHDHIAADPRFRERFSRETVLMAKFHHPHAVTLYDASLTDPAGSCIVMEYVKGANLETLLAKNGKFTAPRVARLLGQVCEVLQAAHDQGVVHRDLKPANLMVIDPDTPRERVKVMDFGLAKRIDETPMPGRKVTDTTIDFAVGTPGYIAPEQVRGEPMDHRGDLYAVGVMAYELLTGRLPFTGASGIDVLLAHATETPPTFEDLGVTGVPREVEELVFDCLAKDPEDRPQSARDLAERFDTAIDSAQAKVDSGGFPVSTGPGPGGSGVRRPPSGGYAVAALTPEPVALAAVEEKPGLTFEMEAWMPEQVALMKLRGFVHAYGGEVAESSPGLIRVRLGKTSAASAAMGWLGLRRSGGPLDVELHLGRAGGNRIESKMGIKVVFRPAAPGLLGDDAWRERCNQAFVELRAYLMGGG